MSKILTVIFGAGASFDCQNIYNAQSRRVRIPLTNGLFTVPDIDVVHFGHQKEILKKYKGADVVGHLFERQKTSGIKNLEEFLRDLLKTGTDNTKKNLRQIPFYLRELIGDFGEMVRDEFRQSDYINLIHYLDISRYGKIILITLNYDLLLDWALENALHANLTTFDSYLGHQNRWFYLKYHGSVNWFYEIKGNLSPGSTRKEKLDWLCEIQPNSDILKEAEKKISKGHYELSSDSGFKFLFYPIMVLPNAEEKSHICPDNHIEAVRPFLNECEDFLVIGNSMQDLDIMELLKREARKAKKVFVVDRIVERERANELNHRVYLAFPRAEIQSELEIGFANFVTNLNSKKVLFGNAEEIRVL